MSASPILKSAYEISLPTWKTRTGTSILPTATSTRRSRPAIRRWKRGGRFTPLIWRAAVAARRTRKPRRGNGPFRFEEDVQNALAGRLQQGTQTYNGSNPGIFRATPGVYADERRLRLLCGLPLNEQRVIRPSDDPPAAPVVFDWCKVVGEALARRVELRRQRWQVKHRELELLATKNFLLPNLNFVGRYNVRSFGQTGAGSEWQSGYQEWQAGMQFSMPLGFREGHTAVRNAELLLAHHQSRLARPGTGGGPWPQRRRGRRGGSFRCC